MMELREKNFITTTPVIGFLYTSGTKPQFWDRFISTFFIILVICILHRLANVAIYYRAIFGPTYYPANRFEATEMLWTAHSESLILGVSSDVILAGLSSFVLAFTFIPGSVRMIAYFVLAIVLAANVEHVKYNFTHINFATAENALSWTFIQGQLTSTLAKVFAILVVATVIVKGLMKFRFMRRLGTSIAIPLLIISVLLPIKFSYIEPAWMQTHPLLPNFSRTSSATDMRDFQDISVQLPPASLATNAQYNILLVYLEGLSVKSLEQGNMDYLTGLSENNISFSRYFGNQIITTNGLYSTLTGGLPYFRSNRSKWSEVQEGSEIARAAVPALLRDAGYQTAFLQSAPLAYMNKDTILPLIGFSESLGLGSWSKFYSRNAWGIDDRALFEETIDYVDTLDARRPWFVSVLTTGTHSPYNVPEDHRSGEQTSRYEALAYLDIAIGELMQDLKDRELLENTVVIFTADESREPSLGNPLQDDIFLHWLPMIVVHPSRVRATIATFISSEQFPYILNMVAGNVDTGNLRALNGVVRPLILGNAYSDRLYWFDQEARELLLCRMASFDCAVFEGVDDPTTMDARPPERFARFPHLERVISEIEDGK